ncbi:protein neprosin-like [Lycium ferocissimum]|uniref:protein neprosin-like n=1 Tax=Lycium ferocissimum TaxID=112874 RepID=UPI00281586C0|nr:protein neprosin-like [Lycium ferocissimum]
MMMQKQSICYIFLAIFLLLSHSEVQGSLKLSHLEDLELEEHLKLLNKPAVKTIKMKLTLSLIKEDHDNSIKSWPSEMRLKKESCPGGTVPIRRTTKDDLIRQKLMPPAEDFSFSTSYSHVDPTLYGDNRSRLYTHFKAGNTHCFNTQCPGFVIVNSEIPLDYVYSHVTQRGGDIAWEDSMYITRDLFNGNWWLLLTLNQTTIGFWPNRIFTELNDFASIVQWGGVTYSPPNILEPPMGSSFFPSGDLKCDAYCRKIKTINDIGQATNAGAVTVYMSNPDLYKALHIPNHGSYFEHVVVYGGPGES